MFTPNRIVALLTPVFAGLAGTVVQWCADNLPGGPALDESELTAVFIAGAGAAAAAAYAWLQGWQKHEDREFAADAYPIPNDADAYNQRGE